MSDGEGEREFADEDEVGVVVDGDAEEGVDVVGGRGSDVAGAEHAVGSRGRTASFRCLKTAQSEPFPLSSYHGF